MSSAIAFETLRVFHRQTKTPCHFIVVGVTALAATKSLSLLNNDSTSSHLNQCIMLALVLPNVPEVLKIV